MKMCKAVRKLVFFAGALALACAAQALSLHRDGQDLYLSGTIETNDDLLVKAAHAQAPIRRLVLVNSGGGSILTALRIARWVEEIQASTVVAGYCMSACSLVFMAGAERRFAMAPPGHVNLIAFHSSYSKRTGKYSARGADMMLSYYQERMGKSYDASLMELAIKQTQDSSGFLAICNASPAGSPWHCASSSLHTNDCSSFPEKDGLALGVLTSSEPDSLQPSGTVDRILARSAGSLPVLESAIASVRAKSRPVSQTLARAQVNFQPMVGGTKSATGPQGHAIAPNILIAGY